MPLLIPQVGLERILTRLKATDLSACKIGLFQNDFTPVETSIIGDIQPATFSGYVGLRTMNAWGAVSFVSPRAILNHPPISWVHNGGPVSNWIFGYYVVDSTGVFMWAQRRQGDGVPMNGAGQFYEVAPQFTVRSEF
jgi:hypothetical protein